MEKIQINSLSEYCYAVERGYEPLLDRRFDMDIRLRIEVQRSLFLSHEQFYLWVWEHKVHTCEETMKPLREYSATYVSHILTKGRHPDMAHDPRNTNILCLKAHNQWEFGNREKMRIYERNQLIIKQLKNEYSNT